MNQTNDIVNPFKDAFDSLRERIDPKEKEIFDRHSSAVIELIESWAATRLSILRKIETRIENTRENPTANEQQADAQDMMLILESDKTLIDLLSKVVMVLSQGHPPDMKEIRKLRARFERSIRRIQLQSHSNEQELKKTLKWFSQKGEEDDIDRLQRFKHYPPYGSKDISDLAEIAIDNISQRVDNTTVARQIATPMLAQEMKASYRVFCSASGIAGLPEGVDVEKYGAFTVVSGSEDVIEPVIVEMRKSFPIEKLKSIKIHRPGTNPEETNTPSITPPEYNSGDLKMLTVVVSFNGPIRESWTDHLKEFGAEILEPYGEFSYVVSVPSDKVLAQIKKLDEVDEDEVEPYTPEIRIASKYLDRLLQKSIEGKAEAAESEVSARENGSHEYGGLSLPGVMIASFFTSKARDVAGEILSSQNIKILDKSHDLRLVFDIGSADNPPECFEMIKSLEGLRSLEEKTIPVISNNAAREVISEMPLLPDSAKEKLPWTGKGEIIAIADTGLDTGREEIIHPDFKDRIRIKSFKMTPGEEPFVENFNHDDEGIDKYSGHGTHVAGSALGSGRMSEVLNLEPIQGIAPEAELVFQAVEQSPKWNVEGISRYMPEGRPLISHGLFGIPLHLVELFKHAYENGARIHSNSWNDERYGPIYGDRSTELDDFVWQHKDFLVVVSAGNRGVPSLANPKTISEGSVYPPGTAKNCLTVGASENKRPGQFSETYGSRWPNKFGRDPFRDDCMVDSIDDIAAFSSRGPCPDGRRKPDVVAPGTYILSTRSSQIPNNNFASSPFPKAVQHYMYMSGTSMATPLVAGSAALVRQFLREENIIQAPSAALVKAAIIHSAQYFNYRHRHESSIPWADNEQGWGRINLRSILAPLYPTKVVFIDERIEPNKFQGFAAFGEGVEYKVNITDSAATLRATLVYTDAPGIVLVNNLNLKLTDPDGNYYVGNDFDGSLKATNKRDSKNNVEGVIVKSPKVGQWTIQVIASNIKKGKQDFALVVSGGGVEKPDRKFLSNP